jgi:hypothetical protein
MPRGFKLNVTNVTIYKLWLYTKIVKIWKSDSEPTVEDAAVRTHIDGVRKIQGDTDFGSGDST